MNSISWSFFPPDIIFSVLGYYYYFLHSLTHPPTNHHHISSGAWCQTLEKCHCGRDSDPGMAVFAGPHAAPQEDSASVHCGLQQHRRGSLQEWGLWPGMADLWHYERGRTGKGSCSVTAFLHALALCFTNFVWFFSFFFPIPSPVTFYTSFPIVFLYIFLFFSLIPPSSFLQLFCSLFFPSSSFAAFPTEAARQEQLN